MNKTISIVGPTATGKTDTALGMSNYFLENNITSGVDIISADSRQVYKGLEIITGADIPVGFEIQDIEKTGQSSIYKYPFYKKDDISIHGISLINPDEKWSVTHFRDFARSIMEQSIKQNRLPIIVGGTGLYHQQLFNDDIQLSVKPNIELREKADKLSVQELQEWLGQVNDEKLNIMNNSDKNNTRRLIRAIEISVQQDNQPKYKTLHELESSAQEENHYTLLLSNTLENISSSINKRVEERFKNGAIDEVKNLYEIHSPGYPAFSATGVKEIHDFISKNKTQEEALTKWSLREFQYAKRQLTWWRKNS